MDLADDLLHCAIVFFASGIELADAARVLGIFQMVGVGGIDENEVRFLILQRELSRIDAENVLSRGLRSYPRARRSRSRATSSVVPLPAQGSMTRSFGLV